MKRWLWMLLRACLFLAGLCVAFWIFMPWREVGAAALTLASQRMEQRGMKLSFSGVEGEDGGFSVNGLALGGFMNFACDSVTLRPQLAASLLSLAPVCEVAFRGGSLTVGQAMNFGNGGFLLTASPNEILLERLRTNGDFAVQGYLTVDPARMRIGRAEAALRFPSSFEGNMETLKGFLPLVREGNGNWFLRRGR